MSSQKVAIWDACALMNKRGHKKWTVECIAVEVWKANKTDFGLAGYEGIYPDPRRVTCSLYGKRGMIAKKEILVVPLVVGGQRLYALGKQPVDHQIGKNTESEEAVLVGRLLNTSAVQAYTINQPLTVFDAMIFFGVKLGSHLGGETPRRMVQQLRRIDPGRDVSQGDKFLVVKVAETLLERFCNDSLVGSEQQYIEEPPDLEK